MRILIYLLYQYLNGKKNNRDFLRFETRHRPADIPALARNELFTTHYVIIMTVVIIGGGGGGVVLPLPNYVVRHLPCALSNGRVNVELLTF